MRLQGKTALITGGGTGMGLGSAQALASEGCRVAIAGRRDEVLRQAAATCDPGLLFHAVDVSDRDSVRALFEWANAELRQIDILVNSAGVNIKTRKMSEMTPEQWDSVLRINATGTYNCMYEVLPQMRERRDGLIVNVSSISGKRALAIGGIAYCASKFATAALGTAVGAEEIPNNIRITTVYPGEVNTPFLEARAVQPTPEQRAVMLQPEDVGAMVLAVACLPPTAHVSEIILKPTVQEFV